MREEGTGEDLLCRVSKKKKEDLVKYLLEDEKHTSVTKRKILKDSAERIATFLTSF
jgi:hypothetical protein